MQPLLTSKPESKIPASVLTAALHDQLYGKPDSQADILARLNDAEAKAGDLLRPKVETVHLEVLKVR